MRFPFARKKIQRPASTARRRYGSARPRLESFEDRTLLSIVNWIGASGDWNTAANWSGGQVPGAADDVTIATPSVTVTHNTTAYDQVKSLNVENDAGVTLELSGGTLGVVSANFHNNTVRLTGKSTFMVHAQARSAGTFEMIESDTTLSGAGTLTTQGNALWTAGVLDGNWTVAEGSTLNMSGEKNKILRGSITNEGTVLWSGTGRIGVSSLTVIDNLEGGLWVCQNDSPFLFRNDDGFATHPFNNYGTFRKEGSTGQTAFDGWGELNNFGRVEVNTGTLLVAGGGTNHGAFAVAAGANLQFITFNLNYDLKDGTTFEGEGKVSVTTGGTLSALVPITMPNPFELNAGTLRGDGPLTVTESFLWSGGQLSGNVTVAPDATMDITGSLSMVMKGKLNNFGTITWTSPVPLSITSRSEIVNHTGGIIDLKNDQPFEFHEDDGFAPWLFHNAGTLKKTGGTGTSSTQNALFLNDGTVEVHTGTLFFEGEYFGGIEGNTLAHGTYVVKSDLKIEAADIHSNHATVILDGPSAKIVDENGADAFENLAQNFGIIHVLNGAELTPAGDLENHAGLTIGAGSHVTLGGTLTQSFGVTSIQDGTLTAISVHIEGGYLGGFGTVEADVTNESLLHVGTTDLTGILTIDGNYTQTGTLLVRVGGVSAGSEYDQLQITGTADLAGRLAVLLSADYAPTVGDSYRVLLAEAMNGEFDILRGSGSFLVDVYDPNGVILELPAGRALGSSRGGQNGPRVLVREMAWVPDVNEFRRATRVPPMKIMRSLRRV